MTSFLKEAIILVLFIIILIIVILFFPVSGLLIAGGIVSVMSMVIPILLTSLLALYIIIKIFVAYWDYKEEKTRKNKMKIWNYNRKMGIITEQDFKNIVDFFEIHHSLNIIPFENLSDAQKKTALIRMIKKYPMSSFEWEKEKYLK